MDRTSSVAEGARLLDNVPNLERVPSAEAVMAAEDAAKRQPWHLCMGGPVKGAASREQRWACNSFTAGLATAAACVGYAIVGPLLIVSNKYMINAGFKHPLMLTAGTQLSTALISILMVRVLGLVPRQHELSWEYARTIIVVGFASATTLCLGNSAYLFLSVSFVEILKGFAPVVTMAMQGFYGLGYPRRQSAMAVLLISVCTAVTSIGEVHWSLRGMALLFASIYFEALRLILTQKLLDERKLHPLEALYYISPVSFLFTAAAAVLIDLPRFRLHHIHDPPVAPFWACLLTSALLGFFINLSSNLVIQRTNVVMLKLLALSRNAAIVVCGVVLFGDHVSQLQVAGYAATLVFFLAYNYLQIADSATS